ncbi:MAG TPA: DNA polymerase III subunit delta [Alphaproteobacteria bacterium]|nr:DNA polymerase III subunit delta [Alphaproteobacteria bacterium]
MKLAFRDIEPFVKKPDPAARVVLVYGPDSGLMKERAASIGKSVVADLSDPFAVAVLNADGLAEDPARLNDEAYAISMMGGGRLIRVENAGDKITPLVKDYLANPNQLALIVLEAGELGPKSSLRALCEKAANAAAVPCYVEDERDLGRLIRETLQGSGLSAESDAVTALASAIAGNRAKARSELDKLITYKGTERSPVSLDDVLAICGDAGALDMDRLTYAVAGREPAAALKALESLSSEGIAEIALLRALQSHFRKLHYCASLMADNGMDAETAMKKLTPPIFFKQEGPFRAQLSRWNLQSVANVLQKLSELEGQTKQTGFPPDTLAAQAILGLSASRR